MSPTMRGGSWWEQQADGSWLRWNDAAQTWESQSGQPPPPDAGPTPAYAGQPGYYQAQAPGQGPAGYGGGGPGYGGGQPGSGSPPGRVLTILGFVFGVIAILFFPIILGPAAIICAGIGMSKGDPLGRWALAVAIGGTVLGFVLGFIYYESITS